MTTAQLLHAVAAYEVTQELAQDRRREDEWLARAAGKAHIIPVKTGRMQDG